MFVPHLFTAGFWMAHTKAITGAFLGVGAVGILAIGVVHLTHGPCTAGGSGLAAALPWAPQSRPVQWWSSRLRIITNACSGSNESELNVGNVQLETSSPAAVWKQAGNDLETSWNRAASGCRRWHVWGSASVRGRECVHRTG